MGGVGPPPASRGPDLGGLPLSCLLVNICRFGHLSHGSVVLSVMLASPCQFQQFRR